MRPVSMMVFAALLVVVSTSPVSAQYTFSAGSAVGAVDDEVKIPTYMIIDDDADAVSGLSWGVCHDDEVVSIDDLEDGADLDTIGGAFAGTALYAGGWTCGLVVSFSGGTVGAGTYEVFHAVYTLDGEGVTDLDFCGTLGVPAVTLSVVVSGASDDPTELEDGSIVVTDLNAEDYTLRISDAAGAAGGTAAVSVELEISDTGEAMDAVEFGVCHGDLLEGLGEDDIVEGEDFEPSFFTIEVVDGGWTASIIADELEPARPADEITVLADVTYTLGDEGGTADLEFCSELGDPEVAVRVIQGPVALEPLTENGSIEISTSPSFLRGDANNNGSVDGIPDGLFMLRWGFAGGDDPECEDAADADDSGELTGLGDGLYVLFYSFKTGSPEPPLPGPTQCGPDPEDEPDELGCESTSKFCQP